jgi:hypothetical protein
MVPSLLAYSYIYIYDGIRILNLSDCQPGPSNGLHWSQTWLVGTPRRIGKKMPFLSHCRVGSEARHRCPFQSCLLRIWIPFVTGIVVFSICTTNQINSIFCCSLLAFRIKLWNRLLYVIDLLCCSNPICLSCELFCACWLVLLLGLCFLSVAADWPITDCQAHWAYFHNESESAWPTQTRGDRGQAAMGRAKSVIHSTLFPFAVLLQ